jgi:hypothetical protein
MANQAFALSPISARASLPGEEDYEAIREAFMETARGRWFLDEYARRNRNADTRMVLDAVSRVEETIAQQHQAPPPPPPEDKRPELLAIFRSAFDYSEQAATAALDRLGLKESLAPIRKGARIIKEISWRWREIGADGRICDLLDSQVGAIEAGCETVAAADPRLALCEAFDTIRASISAFSDIAGVAPTVATVVDEAMAEGVEAPADEAEPYDEDMLERVALEMAAPDLDDSDAEFAVAVSEAYIAEPEQAEVAEPPQVEVSDPPQAQAIEPPRWETTPVASAPEPVVAEQPAGHEPEASLGATILATGLVTRPKAPANDPLAPIRRMTQAEKIAFFS